jgi:hypothetical protein
MNYILSSLFSRALPYLDPGSGSILIQLAIGAVLGVGVFIRVFWKNINAFFTGKKITEDSVEDPTTILNPNQIIAINEDPTAIVDEELSALPSDTTSIEE